MKVKIKKVTKVLMKMFEKEGFQPRVGDGWLNIARQDGVHCEFTACYPDHIEAEVYTATYTIDDKEKTLDFELPGDEQAFIESVKKILKD